MGHPGIKGKIQDLFDGKHGRLFAWSIAFSGNEGCAEGTHDPCNIGTDGLAAGDPFKASENGIVVEGAALYNNTPAQIAGTGDLDHLEQSVFND